MFTQQKETCLSGIVRDFLAPHQPFRAVTAFHERPERGEHRLRNVRNQRPSGALVGVRLELAVSSSP